MRLFGELSLQGTEREPRWCVTGSLPVMFLNRLIPEAYTLRSDQCALSDTLSNVETIEWLMMRFPLSINKNAKRYWNRRVKEVHVGCQRRETLEALVPVTPSRQFIGKLRDFQKLGLDFLMKTGGHALLADEMGLGKGVQALAYLATAKDALPVYIVAPLVTLKHWEREIIKFLRVSGKSATVKVIRSGKRAPLPSANIYLTNYDLLAKRVEDVRDKVRTVIFDEIQALRNTQTLRYRAALELLGGKHIVHVIGLSGTPIHNNGAELWAITNLLRPGLLGTYHEFVAQHCGILFGKIHARNPKGLYELLRQEFLLRRRKFEVMSELPPLLRVKEYIDADLDLYKAEVTSILETLDQKLEFAKTEFERTAFKQHVVTQERQVAAICKIPYVVKWVRACLESEQPIIVYFHHLLVRDALVRYLKEWDPCIIVGGQTDTERDNEIQRFQGGKSRLLLSGIRAGSLGITLTAGSVVVFAELDWTPAWHRQAEGRSHRIGQENQVLAYYLVAEGTLDEKVAEVLMSKTQEINELLGDEPEGENTPEALNAIEELRKLPAFQKVPIITAKYPDMINRSTRHLPPPDSEPQTY